jgi:hypothetical protein
LPLSKRLVSAVSLGLGFGIIYSVIGGLQFLVHGDAMTQRYHIGVSTLIELYLVGGVIVGLIVGTLGRWTRTHRGAVIVGILAAVPALLVVDFTLPMPGISLDERIKGALTAALALGGGCGWVLWHPGRPRSSDRSA